MSYGNRGVGCSGPAGIPGAQGSWDESAPGRLGPGPHLLQVHVLWAAQGGQELATTRFAQRHHHNEVVPVARQSVRGAPSVGRPDRAALRGGEWGISFLNPPSPTMGSIALQPQPCLNLQAINHTDFCLQSLPQAVVFLELLCTLQSPSSHTHTFLEPLILLCPLLPHAGAKSLCRVASPPIWEPKTSRSGTGCQKTLEKQTQATVSDSSCEKHWTSTGTTQMGLEESPAYKYHPNTPRLQT